jgi:hypothetical protein
MRKGVIVVLTLIAMLGLTSLVQAQQFKGPNLEELKPILKIQWRLGPDYPMGIQESAVGIISGKVVSAGGFSRHPKDVVKHYPDAFGGEPSGFTKLTFMFDPQNESAGWKRITDRPGPARQGAAVAVVDNMLYAMGGFSYTQPTCYRDTYRLLEKDGQWVWEELQTCRLPWPVYVASNGAAVIGKKISLFGVADYFASAGANGPDFHVDAGRTGVPVGRALLVLDTPNLKAGWKRLADYPGVPKFNAGLAAVGGKLYALGGQRISYKLGPGDQLIRTGATMETEGCNVTDSWKYDPASNQWTQLRDVPHGCARTAIVYADRYIVLVSGYKFAQCWPRRRQRGWRRRSTLGRGSSRWSTII